MKVTLPVVTKNEIVDGKRVIEYGDKTFDLDPSLACQIRWEAKFPEIASREDLISYTERTKEQKELTMAVILAKLKTVYCFFDTDLTFLQFIKLFDLSNREYVERLTEKLREIFEVISDGAAEKN